ncbi:hypothetical protein [Curtobacterium flaccumfaciens]|uniref:hypothetical protein n=1 Tax=Curtobacterium flaccumfaciens TaxID=2035 RepID=UPI001266B6D9|nr:hypothetical protein [Curtobacterium flaccumfaciens]MBT1667316.1 hypothetical protein [Curtobacterium flaccumfaciens pv. flaccumfaciens]QFS79484.1 hypothetical protein GBG65_08540 [Curtobacterium flaccumfaciens pv. flaccumfaciens]
MTDDNAVPTADEEPTKWDPSSDPDGYTRDEMRSKDLLLDAVLDFGVGRREEPGGSFNLTVTLGGQMVSGRAISRGEWADAVATQYEQGGGTEYLRKVFDLVNEKIIAEQKRREGADLPIRGRRFLHMKDVRIGIGGKYTEMPYWRGALDDIVGWSLGSWNPPTAATE